MRGLLQARLARGDQLEQLEKIVAGLEPLTTWASTAPGPFLLVPRQPRALLVDAVDVLLR